MSLTHTSYSQPNERIFEVDQDSDYDKQLIELFQTTDLEKLKIVIPENSDGFSIMTRINHKHNYESPSVFFDYKIEQLPEELGDLSELKYLDIRHLGLTSLPAGITKLEKLEYLDISYNLINITDELDKLKTLKNLKTIKLYFNPVSSEEIYNLEQLKLRKGVHYKLEDYENESLSYHASPTKPNKRKQIINKLYVDARKYYAFGLGSNRFYQGYDQLLKILETKINDHIDESKETTWKRFVRELRSEVGSYHILDIGYSQFPSYKLSIMISDEENDQLRERKSVDLSISLLTNHFTIHCESTIFLKEYRTSLDRPLVKHVYYGIKNANEEEKVLFEKLQHLVGKYFSHYEFVNHEILFNSSFKGGVPHGEGEHYSRDSYPIFSFLFDLSAGFQNLDVLE